MLKCEWILLVCVLFAAFIGCDANSPAMHVWGTVSYNGEPVSDGQIIFSPVDESLSPSTGGAIQNGKFDIPKKDGPSAGGIYRVEITGYGELRSYAPNASGKGPTFEVREQLIPDKYNRQSKLTVTISPSAADNQHDFELAP